VKFVLSGWQKDGGVSNFFILFIIIITFFFFFLLTNSEGFVRRNGYEKTCKRSQDDEQEKRIIIYDQAILLHLRCWSEEANPMNGQRSKSIFFFLLVDNHVKHGFSINWRRRVLVLFRANKKCMEILIIFTNILKLQVDNIISIPHNKDRYLLLQWSVLSSTGAISS
jgi:hypothetical protein